MTEPNMYLYPKTEFIMQCPHFLGVESLKVNLLYRDSRYRAVIESPDGEFVVAAFGPTSDETLCQLESKVIRILWAIAISGRIIDNIAGDETDEEVQKTLQLALYNCLMADTEAMMELVGTPIIPEDFLDSVEEHYLNVQKGDDES